METAANAGLIVGFAGNFRPEEPITRLEMAVIMSRALGLRQAAPEVTEAEVTATLARFDDGASIESWGSTAVTQVVEAGLMQGRKLQEYAPQEDATRAEAVVVLKRLLENLGDI